MPGVQREDTLSVRSLPRVFTMAYDFKTLHCSTSHGVLTTTINNPPVNVMTAQLYFDLVNFTQEVEADRNVSVVVMQSADPDFFIAHFDIEEILRMPNDTEPERASSLSPFHQMCQRMRTMPKATIAKIGGRAGGGGNEFASNFDMRFGVRGKTVINQMEVALGILPGGTGTQTLPRLVGRNRAMEIMLGSDDIDGATLEQWGYLNRAFDTVEDMDKFVDRLARRIASWPADAIRLCKASVNQGDQVEEAGMIEEAYLFQQTLRTLDAQRNMRKAMNLGAQTLEGELRIADLCDEVARRD